MIDDCTVDHVARLGRLDLTPEERARFKEQLGSILEYVRQLESVDLTGVPATAHALPMTNVLRDDEAGPSLPREEALAAAPVAEDGYVVVPPVIEGEHA